MPSKTGMYLCVNNNNPALLTCQKSTTIHPCTVLSQWSYAGTIKSSYDLLADKVGAT